MTTLTSIFIMFSIGAILFYFGKKYSDYTQGILGGLLWFLTGVSVVLNPIENVDSLLNLVIGSILFAVGGYIWVKAGLEQLGMK